MKLFLSPLLAVAFLLSIFPIGSVRSDPAAYILEIPESHTELPYVSTDEVVERFPRRASHPTKLEVYLNAEGRFPSLASCMSPSESDSRRIDATKFNWSNFHSTAEIDICMFRVTSQLASELDIAAWLNSVGFARVVIQDEVEVQRVYYGYNGTAVRGTVSTADLEEFGTRFGPSSPLKEHSSRARAISVVIHVMGDEIVEVSFRFSFL